MIDAAKTGFAVLCANPRKPFIQGICQGLIVGTHRFTSSLHHAANGGRRRGIGRQRGKRITICPRGVARIAPAFDQGGLLQKG